MLESKIQADIVKYLQHRKVFCHSVPNEQSHGNAVRTGQLVAMGLRTGCADLVIWLGCGRIAYCEVKNEKGRQSEFQKKFQELCEQSGYPYRVVRSVDDVKAYLEDLGLEDCDDVT